MEKYLLEDWTQLEMELLRERGLWGPPVGSDLDKWQLDTTEGPLRTRKRMLRNDMFYIHYPYRPDLEDVGIYIFVQEVQSFLSQQSEVLNPLEKHKCFLNFWFETFCQFFRKCLYKNSLKHVLNCTST